MDSAELSDWEGYFQLVRAEEARLRAGQRPDLPSKPRGKAKPAVSTPENKSSTPTPATPGERAKHSMQAMFGNRVRRKEAK